MVERRPLIEGLKPSPSVDVQREKEFVYGEKAAVAAAAPAPPTTFSSINRVPLTTRIRSDFASALKRASLERQLNGVEPHTLQDMLEQAIEPWLRANGYIAQ